MRHLPSEETREIHDLLADVARRWPNATPGDLRWQYAIEIVRRYPGLTTRPAVSGLLPAEHGGEGG